MIRPLTLLVALSAATAHAQVTLQASLLPDTYSDRLYIVTSTGDSETPTPGVDQTWDLSTATIIDVGTFTHGPAAATPYAADYAQADIAWHLDMGVFGHNYTYFALSTSLDMVATDVPDSPNEFTDLLRVLTFPMEYGDTFTDTWAGTEGSGSVQWTYAGIGTAITPVGTFDNVALLVNDNEELALWRTDPLVPLVVVRDGTTFAVGPATVGIVEHDDAQLAAYPVPCSDRLWVQATAAAPWHIVDMHGRTVMQGRFTTPGRQAVDTDALLPGAYVLMQQGTDGRRVAHFVKQ